MNAVVRGLVAGAVGTAAMDALLFARYRRGGGETRFADWEFSSGLESWEDAPAPAHVASGWWKGCSTSSFPPQRARLVNNVTHWAFGMVNGAAYGLVAGSLPRPRISYGLPFGAIVWADGYVVLPAAKLYEPIWKYDVKTLSNDLSAHLVYGLTAATWRLLAQIRASAGTGRMHPGATAGLAPVVPSRAAAGKDDRSADPDRVRARQAAARRRSCPRHRR